MKKFHLIGIGGAGMSAIACLLKGLGYEVQGSDLKESRYTRIVAERGIPVFIGHREENIGDADAVVYSTAVPSHNVELRAARRQGIMVLHRAEALRYIAAGRKVIAVTGTHGKTSTTSLLAHALWRLGIDASVLVGSELNEVGANAYLGKADILVLEADESDGTFLHVTPDYALVMNLENDHLDHYGDLSELEKAFVQFMQLAKKKVLFCADDVRLHALVKKAGVPAKSFGLSEKAAVRASEIEVSLYGTRFLVEQDKERAAAHISLKGAHYAANAAGVVALLLELGFSLQEAAAALEGFGGVARRFELRGSTGEIDIYDDYAHHPSEVRAVLRAAREMGYRRIVCVFQPHRYSRLSHLMQEFAAAFADADFLVFTEIYSAGEEPIPGVSGKRLFELVAARHPEKKLAFLPRLPDIPAYLERVIAPGDAVIFMGAGDINVAARELSSRLLERA